MPDVGAGAGTRIESCIDGRKALLLLLHTDACERRSRCKDTLFSIPAAGAAPMKKHIAAPPAYL